MEKIKKMLIVSAGRSRSGSTVLFNIQRLTLEVLFGKENIHARYIRFYDKKREAKYHLVKIHGENEYLFEHADYIFSAQRNIIDQAVSMLKFGKLHGRDYSGETIFKKIKYDFGRYKKWVEHSKFVKSFHFDDLVYNKEKVIKEFCNEINLEIDDNKIGEILSLFKKIKIPNKSGPNKITCLRQYHITKNIKVDIELPDDMIKRLRKFHKSIEETIK